MQKVLCPILLVVLVVVIVGIGAIYLQNNNKASSVINSSSDAQSNDLIVYASINANENQATIYSYDLLENHYQEIYSFSLNESNSPPLIRKYQNNSILIYPDGKRDSAQVINLEGKNVSKVINPGYYDFLFSPSKKWLVYTELQNNDYFVNIVNTATNQEISIPWGSIPDLTGYLIPKKWSGDETVVYASVGFEGGDYIPGVYKINIHQEKIIPLDITKEGELIMVSFDNKDNVYGLIKSEYDSFAGNYAKKIEKIDIATGTTEEFHLKQTVISQLGSVKEDGTYIFYNCPLNDNSSDLCLYNFFDQGREKVD